MDELKIVVERRWNELNSKGRSNNVEDVSEDMLRAEIQKNISQEDSLFRGISSKEELDALTDKFYWNMPEMSRFGSVGGYVCDIGLLCRNIAKKYGIVSNQDLNDKEFAFYSDFNYPGKEKLELRVLPDHPVKDEIIGRMISLEKKRKEFGRRQNVYPGSTSEFIPANFDDWRSALAFANYSHMWSNKHNLKKILPEKIAGFNAKRYKQFNLTSEKSVREISPGALFQIENVFGEFAKTYVGGDVNKCKELIRYVQTKGAKEYFNDVSQGDFSRFKADFSSRVN